MNAPNPASRDTIVDGFCYRLNPDEVVCLTCYVESCVCLWTAGFYNQQQADR